MTAWRKVLAWELVDSTTAPPYDPENPRSLWRAFTNDRERQRQFGRQLEQEIEQDDTARTFTLYYNGYASTYATVQARNAAEAYFLSQLGYERNYDTEVGDDWELHRISDESGEDYEI